MTAAPAGKKKTKRTGGVSAYLDSSSWSLTAERRTVGMSESMLGKKKGKRRRGRVSRLSG